MPLAFCLYSALSTFSTQLFCSHVVAIQRFAFADVELAAGHDRVRPGVALVGHLERADLRVLVGGSVRENHPAVRIADVEFAIGGCERRGTAALAALAGPQHLARHEVGAPRVATVVTVAEEFVAD